ncbi:hypothetical protein DCCM_4795 [Desulfocucumis palustris]|uniref:Uncharacterized protein n=1 Tax=Desulfocucumis palustris TaxID=1898651 RepID=A0A2L2XMU3_9FIRM|nr:hypothetical protein [Desulfocucumis palustris]GBF35666.1 hypothetical protein DCCM_4795 [Desulfocucumis palustris]
MPVSTVTVLAMRCPECGRMEFHKISRFAVVRDNAYKVFCACGALKMVIHARSYAKYNVTISCVFCGGSHTRAFSGKHLWSGRVIELLCADTGLGLAHIGQADLVRRAAAEKVDGLDDLINEFGGDGYFHNSTVMNDVLKCLHGIAEKGMLYCQCGDHQIGVEIFPDRLELHCKNCGGVNIIYAETEEDLNVIRQVDEIELAKNGFEYLDSLASTGKIKKSRPKHHNKT